MTNRKRNRDGSPRFTDNTIRRTISKGVDSTQHNTVTSNYGGYEKELESKKGYYEVEFVKEFKDVTERDLELRQTYGIDLISGNLFTPVDMIRLEEKNKGESNQTVTSLDEVFYIRIGKRNIGKLSIRTQRVFNKVNLIFVMQKRSRGKKDRESYKNKPNVKPKSTSQKQEEERLKRQRRRDNRTD